MKAKQRINQLVAETNTKKLCQLLKHRDAQIRREAVSALGQLQDPFAVPSLMKAVFEDRDQYVQSGAMTALGEIGDDEAVNGLLQIMFSTRQQFVRQAEQVLSTVDHEHADRALAIRDISVRNDWDALEELDDKYTPLLESIMKSEQFEIWPFAKRERTLRAAITLESTSLKAQQKDLIDIGVFVSGVHTIDDLLRGLRHSNPKTRISAAKRMGDTGEKWLSGVMYRQFKKIARTGGDHEFAATCAQSMIKLNDDRAISFCKKRLYSHDDPSAARCARLLAKINLPKAVEVLFWFVVEAPPSPAYQSLAVVRSSLESTLPDAVDILRPVMKDELTSARRLYINLLTQSNAPDKVFLLGVLCKDEHPEIQHRAIQGLVRMNSPESADKLYELIDIISKQRVVEALKNITQLNAGLHLRKLAVDETVVSGRLLERGDPLGLADIQLIQEQQTKQQNWLWEGITVRGRTDKDGKFTLPVISMVDQGRVRIKVTLPTTQHNRIGDALLADVNIRIGEHNYVEAQVDRLLNRLVVSPVRLYSYSRNDT